MRRGAPPEARRRKCVPAAEGEGPVRKDSILPWTKPFGLKRRRAPFRLLGKINSLLAPNLFHDLEAAGNRGLVFSTHRRDQGIDQTEGSHVRVHKGGKPAGRDQ